MAKHWLLQWRGAQLHVPSVWHRAKQRRRPSLQLLAWPRGFAVDIDGAVLVADAGKTVGRRAGPQEPPMGFDVAGGNGAGPSL